MKLDSDGLPAFPSRKALDRRQQAAAKRYAAMSPAQRRALAAKNAAYEKEQEAAAAERARIRAELKANREAFYAAQKG